MTKEFDNNLRIIEADTVGDPWIGIGEYSVRNDIMSYVRFYFQRKCVSVSISIFNLKTRLKGLFKGG